MITIRTAYSAERELMRELRPFQLRRVIEVDQKTTRLICALITVPRTYTISKSGKDNVANSEAHTVARQRGHPQSKGGDCP